MATPETKNLHTRVTGEDGEQILRGTDLEVKLGEIHTLVGSSGSGKSMTSKIIAGHPAHEVTDGGILLRLEDDDFGDLKIPGDARTWNLLELEPDERVASGIFPDFQYPTGIEDVTMTNFLRVALNAKVDKREELLLGEDTEEEKEEVGYDTSPMEGNIDDGEVGIAEFQKLFEEKINLFDMDEKFMQRYLNAGFFGSKKKQSEVLQAVILEPSITVLDEIDPGLNIDRL